MRRHHVSTILSDDRLFHTDVTPAFTLEQMQAYIYYVKHTLHPGLDPLAERLLAQYYKTQRQTEHRNLSRTTIRMLESLVRLCQGG